MNKPHYFFWGGLLSNWRQYNFVCDGITYNCVEQYMMWSKAMFFGDVRTAYEIMVEDQPVFQKQLGRSVIGFVEDEWDQIKYDIVKKGVAARFSADKEAKDFLLSFEGFTIVEASPEDRIWGIGFSKEDAWDNVGNWGENLLGQILMEVRDEFSEIEVKMEKIKVFRPWKAGDPVYSKGIVSAISKTGQYTVNVEIFGRTETFTQDGLFGIDNPAPSISFLPTEQSMPFDEIEIAIDTPVWVRSNEGVPWEFRFFSHFAGGKLRAFDSQKKSNETEQTCPWKLYSFENPFGL